MPCRYDLVDAFPIHGTGRCSQASSEFPEPRTDFWTTYVSLLSSSEPHFSHLPGRYSASTGITSENFQTRRNLVSRSLSKTSLYLMNPHTVMNALSSLISLSISPLWSSHIEKSSIGSLFGAIGFGSLIPYMIGT